MLKTILSISGRPGLFRLLSNSKNMIIVESLKDKKKLPIHARDRIVSLGDISIYTINDEVLLKDVLITIKKKEDGKETSISPNAKPDILTKYFKEILPEYDSDRVHLSDMKKVLAWYNLLVNADIDFDKFNQPEQHHEEEITENDNKESES